MRRIFTGLSTQKKTINSTTRTDCAWYHALYNSGGAHILDTQRVCSVGLTTASANLYRLLREHHRIFFTGFELSFQRGARNGNLRGPGGGAAAENFYTKPLCCIFYSTQRFSASFFLFLFCFCSTAEGASAFSVEWSPWRAWRPTTPKRSSRTAPSLPAGGKMRFTNTRARRASACLSTASQCSRCFKAKSSHHLQLWAAPTPRRLMSSLSRNGNRRAKISGVFYFLPHLAPRTTPLRSSRESGQKMERGMDRWRGRLSLRIAAATLRRPKGRARRNSHKDGARPGLRRLIFRPGRVP